MPSGTPAGTRLSPQLPGGWGSGLWSSGSHLRLSLSQDSSSFLPSMDGEESQSMRLMWHSAREAGHQGVPWSVHKMPGLISC